MSALMILALWLIASIPFAYLIGRAIRYGTEDDDGSDA